MNAYSTIQALIKENQGTDFFPPLDENGTTSFVEGGDGILFLFVYPQAPETGEDPLFLYMPLLSLVGVHDDTLLAFMIELAQSNMVGALPTGYRLFYEREQQMVYLGGQFSISGLDSSRFRNLVEDFIRFGRIEGPRLKELLTDLVQKDSNPAEKPSAPAFETSIMNNAQLNFAAGMLKV